MAIYQFTFYLVPNDGIHRLHGRAVLTLPYYQGMDPATFDDEAENPNYWEGKDPRSYGPEFSELLQPTKSWAPEALMFAEEDSADDVELWPEECRIRLDMRNYDEHLARECVRIAARDDLRLVMSGTGRVLPADYEKLVREMKRSTAAKFVLDPIGTLRGVSEKDD